MGDQVPFMVAKAPCKGVNGHRHAPVPRVGVFISVLPESLTIVCFKLCVASLFRGEAGVSFIFLFFWKLGVAPEGFSYLLIYLPLRPKSF